MARNLKSKKALKKRTPVYMTRGEALKKLQLSLKDFRRLCILKGIYPVEPKKKTTLTRNKPSQAKTYYLRKDIQYLSHEPIIWRFWDFKIFMRRIAKAKGRRDKEWVQRIRENKPFYKLDHIVKERYPTLIDALRDLDDALSMCFLYSMFGKSKQLPLELIELSRRLTLEFMYYVMETKSLRKVFISIKGYYYEANVMGQVIRWVIPHKFVMTKVPNVDFQIMKTFTEFYITLLGFINYKLYVSNSYFYPPKFFEKTEITQNVEDDDGEYDSDEIIAALNRPLIEQNKTSRSFLEEQSNIDCFESEGNDEEIKYGQSNLTFHQLQKLQNLFSGLKFFINREVPREALCFVIRSFSGEVSWDKNLFPGATFDEDDQHITHQIVDREMANRYMNRDYIQPQWVFDCINSRKLLPVQNYFIGARLPPHLSPFVEEKIGDYITPDKLAFENPTQSSIGKFGDEPLTNEIIDEEEDIEAEEDVHEDKEVQEEKSDNNNYNKMVVMKGKYKEINKRKQTEQQEMEEKRLRVMLMPKKKKKLYDRIMKNVKTQNRETKKLQRKREEYEKNIRNQKQKKIRP